jgi:hypothetical protein
MDEIDLSPGFQREYVWMMLPPYSRPHLIRSKRLVSPCSLLPPELPRRPHFQRRMRMYLVEVLEGRWQLSEAGRCTVEK